MTSARAKHTFEKDQERRTLGVVKKVHIQALFGSLVQVTASRARSGKAHTQVYSATVPMPSGDNGCFSWRVKAEVHYRYAHNRTRTGKLYSLYYITPPLY